MLLGGCCWGDVVGGMLSKEERKKEEEKRKEKYSNIKKNNNNNKQQQQQNQQKTMSHIYNLFSLLDKGNSFSFQHIAHESSFVRFVVWDVALLRIALPLFLLVLFIGKLFPDSVCARYTQCVRCGEKREKANHRSSPATSPRGTSTLDSQLKPNFTSPQVKLVLLVVVIICVIFFYIESLEMERLLYSWASVYAGPIYNHPNVKLSVSPFWLSEETSSTKSYTPTRSCAYRDWLSGKTESWAHFPRTKLAYPSAKCSNLYTN